MVVVGRGAIVRVRAGRPRSWRYRTACAVPLSIGNRRRVLVHRVSHLNHLHADGGGDFFSQLVKIGNSALAARKNIGFDARTLRSREGYFPCVVSFPAILTP
jgi:hypothetical protein